VPLSALKINISRSNTLGTAQNAKRMRRLKFPP
jgi:hypothetical protein